MITLTSAQYIKLGEKWLESGVANSDFQRAQMSMEVEIGIKVLKELDTDISLPIGHVAELMGLIPEPEKQENIEMPTEEDKE